MKNELMEQCRREAKAINLAPVRQTCPIHPTEDLGNCYKCRLEWPDKSGKVYSDVATSPAARRSR